MNTIASYTEELLAEIDALERDLAKLSKRVEDIDKETYAEGGASVYRFREQLKPVKEHVDSAWRTMQYSRANLLGH